jgi:Protein of unknown function (DUF2892)
MKSNMGSLDKFIRILSAMLIIGAYFTKEISGTLAVVLLLLATVFIITSFIGFCPLYSIFGISTKKDKQ